MKIALKIAALGISVNILIYMRLSLKNGIWTLVLGLLVAACSSAPSAKNERVLRFENDVTVVGAGGHKTDYKKGEVISLPQEAVQVEAPGRVGVLVLPEESTPGETILSMRPIESFGGPQLNRLVNQRLNEVLKKVVEAQKLLASGKAREALLVIESTQDKNPELTYLNFIKASCLVVLGERDRARAALDAALAAFPDDEAGRALAATIQDSGSGRSR